MKSRFKRGATPQQVALINARKLYVTCAAAHEVHVVDIPNRNVTKVLTGAFNKPTGITLLNGKAYVSNPAWEWDPEARMTTYYESSVTVIDTATDIVLKSFRCRQMQAKSSTMVNPLSLSKQSAITTIFWDISF